jgi:iron complex outermembrane receptor protein
MNHLMVSMLLGTACAMAPWYSNPAEAQGRTISIQSGSLRSALEAYSRTTGVQIIYRPEEVVRLTSPGASGVSDPVLALHMLLAGTGMEMRRDRSGAIAVVKSFVHKPINSRVAVPASTASEPVAVAVQSVSSDADPSEDIIVTARKREETSIGVPVAISAIGGAALERRGISDLNALTRIVPALQIGTAGGAAQGGTITLRGIGGTENNALADQAVSFNIDGSQIARSSVQRMAQMDIEQIEVLKGPQSLFFGKNSPGGVISLRTADPGPQFAAQLRAGYEVNAHEWQGDGFISGPLTDALGARFAFYGSKMRGWQTQTVPQSSPYGNLNRYLPNNEEFAGRLTLKLDTGGRLKGKLKVAYNRVTAQGSAGDQYIYCPGGLPFNGDITECRADDKFYRPGFGPTFGTILPQYRNGVPYAKQEQWLGSLQMEYRPVDSVSITSVSSLYDMYYIATDNFARTVVPQAVLAAYNELDIREISQEVRVATDFDASINLLVGGYFQHSDVNYGSAAHRNALAPVQLNNYSIRQDGQSYSIFGQAIWKVIPTLELSMGGRYSHERKSIVVRAPAYDGPQISTPVPRASWEDFSPEIALTWRPTQKLTFFGTYKEGFLSGGFNGGGGSLTGNRVFDPQGLKGFEIGAKAAMFRGRLRTNLSLYDYKITGQQVTLTSTTGNVISQFVTNAGRSGSRGVDFDMAYRTPIDGLSVHSEIAYTDARYKRFNVVCYRGQSVAQGCNLQPNAAGIYTQQDFAGRPILRAPDWTAGFGADYDFRLTNLWSMGLSADAAYSSGFDTVAEAAPGSHMNDYWLLDASLRIFSAYKHWEAAIIGKNLTNRYYWTRSTQIAFTGTGSGTAVAGTNADIMASVERGRQVLMRVSYRF